MIQERVPLGELIRIKHGFAFKGEHFTNSGKYIVLTPGNFRNEGGLKLKGEKEKYYAIQPPDDYILEEGDLLVVMTDLVGTAPMLGGSLIVPESDRFLHNQRLGLVTIVDEDRIGKGYLYHLLNTPNYRGQIRGSASGATVRHTAPERIYKAIVNLPERRIQDRVSQIVDSYNDLISNNRRRIKLLEEAARLIYREWFLRLRFPGHELIKIDNGIPEDWQRMPVAQAIDFNPKETLAKGGIRFVPMGALSESGMTVEANLTEIRESGTTVKFRNGDTLLARITPCLENGKTAFVGFLSEGEVASGSTEFIVMRGAKVGACFTYCLARSEDFRGIAVASMVGSSGRQRAQVSVIGEFSIVLPPSNVLDDFESLVQPMFDQIWTLVRANERLTKARDLLLPRLMSGEIEV